MMRLFILSTFLLTHFVALSQSHEQSTDLFDGKSLNGWDFFLVNPDLSINDVWSVEDGLLICKGEPMGYIASEQSYTNFKLVVEWRWAPGKEAGNSGVLMRINGDPQALPICYEAQLQHGNAGDIYGFHGNPVSGDPERFIEKENEMLGKLSGITKMKDNEDEPGDWNTYEIYLLKGTLTLYINGEKVNEAHGLKEVPGKIGLQSEGGEVHFRTIRILPLNGNLK